MEASVGAAVGAAGAGAGVGAEGAWFDFSSVGEVIGDLVAVLLWGGPPPLPRPRPRPPRTPPRIPMLAV